MAWQLFWLVLAAPLLLASGWLSKRMGIAQTPQFSWQRSALRLGVIGLTGVPTWLLFDLGHQLRFDAYLRAGQLEAAKANAPQPLLEIPPWSLMAVLLLYMVLFSGALAIWPEQTLRLSGSKQGEWSSLRSARILGGFLVVVSGAALVLLIIGGMSS